jgi:hypothetical protein
MLSTSISAGGIWNCNPQSDVNGGRSIPTRSGKYVIWAFVYYYFPGTGLSPVYCKISLIHYIMRINLIVKLIETFEERPIMVKYKEGDNFNHMNTLSILRIEI